MDRPNEELDHQRKLLSTLGARERALELQIAAQGSSAHASTRIELDNVRREIRQAQQEIAALEATAQPEQPDGQVTPRASVRKPRYRPMVSRDFEKKVFLEILSSRKYEQVLLMQAGTGMGKSTLLRELLRECERNDARVVFFDLDPVRQLVHVHDIFYNIIKALPDHEFEDFEKNLRSTLTAMDYFRYRDDTDDDESPEEHLRVTALPDMELLKILETVLNSNNDNQRVSLRKRFTHALVIDLARLSEPLTLMIDTYEKASADIKYWLSELLPQVHYRLIVVIAGQEIPEVTENERIFLCELVPITRYLEWYHYCKRHGPRMTFEEIKQICEERRGNPLEISSKLDELRLKPKR